MYDKLSVMLELSHAIIHLHFSENIWLVICNGFIINDYVSGKVGKNIPV